MFLFYVLFWRAKMYWNLIRKSLEVVPFGANMTHIGHFMGIHPNLLKWDWLFGLKIREVDNSILLFLFFLPSTVWILLSSCYIGARSTKKRSLHPKIIKRDFTRGGFDCLSFWCMCKNCPNSTDYVYNWHMQISI